MLRKALIITALLLPLNNASAGAIDFRLGSDMAELTFLTQTASFGYGGADIGFGALINEHNDVIANGSILVSGSSAGDVKALHFGVGAKVYAGTLDGPSGNLDVDGGAVALGAKIRYVFPGNAPLAVLGELYYAPEVTSISDFAGVQEYRLALELEVTPSARAYVGYRKLEVELDNGFDYEVDDDFLAPSVDIVIVNGVDLPSIVGDRMINLVTWNLSAVLPVVTAFENPDRGGKIVQIAGNCSSFESWQSQTAIDAIDWLAPRPKGRILYDLTHNPNYGIDSWDSVFTQNTLTQTGMRNMLVNRSHTFDKLYPPSTLSTQNLEAFDILVIHDPGTNFTAAEVTAVTEWVNDGGSILGIADHTLSKNQNMNYLLSNMDIAINHTATGTNALTPSDEHVTHEGCITMSCLAPGAVGTSGSAFSIWEDVSGVPVIGGDQHGNGRVILIADTAIVRDLRITVADNAQALINFVNWLSSATADVVVYTDRNPAIQPNYNYYTSEVALALNGLGIQYYLTSDPDYLNISLATQSWDLVISDGNYYTAIMKCEAELLDHMESGGKLIMRDWRFRYTGYPLWNYLGFEGNESSISSGPPTVYLWASAHPIFNLPADYGAANINSTHDFFGTDLARVTLFNNATAIAGVSTSPEENTAAIVIGADGRAICNMFSISEYIDDTDNSTYSDAFEIFTNEIAYLYFDRPMIDHPDDITYMESETGNEISWTPTADAGPWEYTVRENGSIIETGLWDGGAITINVDDVNASLTEYELTVFDTLGYSASDLVILNVTEYFDPTTTGTGVPIDPMLLIIIGVGAIVVIVIIIIVMKKKK